MAATCGRLRRRTQRVHSAVQIAKLIHSSGASRIPLAGCVFPTPLGHHLIVGNQRPGAAKKLFRSEFGKDLDEGITGSLDMAIPTPTKETGSASSGTIP